jgi:hypothetical protein
MNVLNKNSAMTIAKKALNILNSASMQNYTVKPVRKYSNITTIVDSMNEPTAAEWLTGMINCTGGGSDTWTLPTGPLLADAMPDSSVDIGDSFECYVINGSGGILTLASASGASITNTTADLTIANGELFKLTFIFNDATADSETYIALLEKST